MIIRIGKCVISEEELSIENYGEVLRECKMSIGDRITNKIENTEWFGKENYINYFDNPDMAKSVCNDNKFCIADSINRSLMESNKFTHEIYNFIDWYFGKIKTGFLNEIENFELTLNFIKPFLTMWNIG